ncbi:MAG TPA: tRNA lysidine(34) synthetase TilS [Gammaproteobacteria bacterium]
MSLAAESGPLADVVNLVRERLNRLPGVRCYRLGLSGGLDSVVLLHILRMFPPAAPLKVIHINHGLRPAAAEWSLFCAELCRNYGIEIDIMQVDAKPAKGESPEAAARKARYAAIEQLLEPGECLLTAHHQDDQAETLLLQLLRGSGPAGLAAMPEFAQFASGLHARPLLAFERRTLHEYALAAGLRWIEDDSNDDERYNRNFLRQRVIPVLRERWPALAQTLTRAALHQAEALELMQALADIDYPQVLNRLSDTLSVGALQALTDTRMRNVLRYWLQQHAALPPSAAVLQQIVNCTGLAADRTPLVEWDNWEVRRYGDELHLLERNPPAPADEYAWSLSAGDFRIPELKLELRLADLLAAGLRVPPATATIYIRFRVGGERIVLPGREHSSSLKKLLQERAIPPWLRTRLPLLYDEQGRLLGVLGIEPPLFTAG